VGVAGVDGTMGAPGDSFDGRSRLSETEPCF
jgi:hypothetical protein